MLCTWTQWLVRGPPCTNTSICLCQAQHVQAAQLQTHSETVRADSTDVPKWLGSKTQIHQLSISHGMAWHTNTNANQSSRLVDQCHSAVAAASQGSLIQLIFLACVIPEVYEACAVLCCANDQLYEQPVLTGMHQCCTVLCCANVQLNDQLYEQPVLNWHASGDKGTSCWVASSS